MATITIERVGQRIYLRGDTYAAKDQIKGIGGHWDGETRAWWVGMAKAAEARELLERLASQPAAAVESSADDPPARQYLAGKCQYKGRKAYIAGRLVRGRTQWDDRVAEVTSRDGQSVMLVGWSGRTWWAPLAEVSDVSAYSRPKTLAGLKRYADECQRNGGAHPDACPACGSTSCAAARGQGGLCDED